MKITAIAGSMSEFFTIDLNLIDPAYVPYRVAIAPEWLTKLENQNIKVGQSLVY